MAVRRRHLDIGWDLERRCTVLRVLILVSFGNVLAFVGLIFWDVNLTNTLLLTPNLNNIRKCHVYISPSEYMS